MILRIFAYSAYGCMEIEGSIRAQQSKVIMYGAHGARAFARGRLDTSHMEDSVQLTHAAEARDWLSSNMRHATTCMDTGGKVRLKLARKGFE
jgi:hypothetical protein